MDARVLTIFLLLAGVTFSGCPTTTTGPDPDEECEGESVAELCGDRQCGTFTEVDRCGEAVTFDCGTCEESEDCEEGVCRCEDARSDGELCSLEGYECGQALVVDGCGDERAIECGSCAGAGENCQANSCNCEPESDPELCAAIPPGQCGPQTFEDRCEQARTLECHSCQQGNATLGVIRDGLSGVALKGAEVRFWAWPPSGGEHYDWEWPEDHLMSTPTVMVTTGSAEGGLNFEVYSEEALCRADGQSRALQAGQWYRIRIDHPDYKPGIYYRQHGDFEHGECPGFCPVSPDSGCHRMDFEVYREDEAHPQKPNLVVDSRDMEDYLWQCALLPPGSSMERVIGLRVRLGASNVGHGPLHLEATPGGNGGEVLQYIHWSDGSVESHVVESGTFTFYDNHFHIHFMEWFAMRLVSPTADCKDIENRSESCVTHRGTKISYCLHDLDPFDGDVRAINDQFAPSFPNPPTCDTTEQGVSAGWKDTYRKRLPGQVILVGSPDETAALGEVWIEAEVDPARVLIDQDRSSMVARKLVQAPTDFDALCSNPETTRDCRGNPASFNADQRRQCRDYLEFVE